MRSVYFLFLKQIKSAMLIEVTLKRYARKARVADKIEDNAKKEAIVVSAAACIRRYLGGCCNISTINEDEQNAVVG